MEEMVHVILRPEQGLHTQGLVILALESSPALAADTAIAPFRSAGS